jgi:hypothetical protein
MAGWKLKRSILKSALTGLEQPAANNLLERIQGRFLPAWWCRFGSASTRDRTAATGVAPVKPDRRLVGIGC